MSSRNSPALPNPAPNMSSKDYMPHRNAQLHHCSPIHFEPNVPQNEPRSLQKIGTVLNESVPNSKSMMFGIPRDCPRPTYTPIMNDFIDHHTSINDSSRQLCDISLTNPDEVSIYQQQQQQALFKSPQQNQQLFNLQQQQHQQMFALQQQQQKQVYNLQTQQQNQQIAQLPTYKQNVQQPQQHIGQVPPKQQLLPQPPPKIIQQQSQPPLQQQKQMFPVQQQQQTQMIHLQQQQQLQHQQQQNQILQQQQNQMQLQSPNNNNKNNNNMNSNNKYFQQFDNDDNFNNTKSILKSPVREKTPVNSINTNREQPQFCAKPTTKATNVYEYLDKNVSMCTRDLAIKYLDPNNFEPSIYLGGGEVSCYNSDKSGISLISPLTKKPFQLYENTSKYYTSNYDDSTLYGANNHHIQAFPHRYIPTDFSNINCDKDLFSGNNKAALSNSTIDDLSPFKGYRYKCYVDPGNLDGNENRWEFSKHFENDESTKSDKKPKKNFSDEDSGDSGETEWVLNMEQLKKLPKLL